MTRQWHIAVLTASVLAPFTLAPALAGPNGSTLIAGSATVQGQGTANVVINQSSQNAIINWKKFNIGAGESTKILMPNASSTELDRVTGGLGPSQILGSLSSNGKVFLVNPDGVLFGPDARINVGSLLTTTSDISNSDFMAGRYNFNIPGSPSASIVNQGMITAQTGGFAALVAPGIRNTGTITAWLGRVGLTSANTFALDFYGDRLIQLDVDDSIASQVIDVTTGKPLKSLISNEGKLEANGGTIELTAVAARRIVDTVINNDGVIEANSVGVHDGMIVLGAATSAGQPADAPTQTVRVSGTLSATGKRKGTTGGTILVTGENVVLSGTRINAAGTDGGGAVLIGGDWGGGYPNTSLVDSASAYLQSYVVPAASTVSIDAATTINASGTNRGNGGKVIVWSDAATMFYGTILAQGGAQSGNGGFVETSGARLVLEGAVNTSGSAGATGTWLLDPTNLTVDAGGAAAISQGLAANNVIVYTNLEGGASEQGTTASGPGDIIIDAPISWSNSNALTLNAYNSIEIDAPISGSHGGLALSANDGLVASAAVNVGTFTLQSGNWSQIAPTLPAFAVSNFVIDGGSFLRAAGGTGSVSSPYQIADVYGLQGMGSSASLLSDNYVLAGNIDASGTASWNNGAGFLPIGNTTNPFSGSMDGQGHVINSLAITSSSAYVGLFGAVGSSGVIENLGITNVKLAAAGWNGLGDYAHVGGLAGINNGTISTSYVIGSITSDSDEEIAPDTGGLVGTNTGLINQSYASVNVSEGGTGASLYLGGLVGWNQGGTISQSYATGAVTNTSAGSALGGGLVGYNSGTVTQVYSIGTVTGLDDIGPLIGGNEGTVTSSYWDTQISGQSTSAVGTGLTTVQFQAGLPAGFDATVWGSNLRINLGYPLLLWELASTAPGQPSQPNNPSNNPSGNPGPSSGSYPNQQVNQFAPISNYTPPQGPIITLADLNTGTGRTNGFAGTPGGNDVTGSIGSGGGSLANGKFGGNGAPPGMRLIDMPVMPLPPGSGLPPPGETRFSSNEVVLQFAPGVTTQVITQIAQHFGLTIEAQQFIGMLGRAVYTFRIRGNENVREVIQLIDAAGLEAAVQPNYTYGLTQDPAGSAANKDDPEQYVVKKLRLLTSHRISKGSNVAVAVIDSEIDPKQPDLAGVLVNRFDAGCGSAIPDPHGTGMAGAIGSHSQLLGVAPGAKIIAICAFGGTGKPEATSVKIIKGLDYAIKQGAKVVNMSFAGPYDPALAQALQVAREKGILIVAAAGNAGPKSPPLYPGADPNVMAVTATDQNDHLFKGANQGKYITIASPGVDVLVPAPDAGVQFTTGTSVATANVSGVAALLIAEKPSLTPEDVRNILVSTARHLGPKGINPEYGAGLVDPLKALQAVPTVKGQRPLRASLSIQHR
jgi:filamentous hemagglutinin family protein